MSALGQVVRSGVGRRRVQTIVIGLVVLIAVTASVLGGSMLVASTAPFDRAFSQQHGAHLTAQFDAARMAATGTTPAQLAASAHATGVTDAAGPFRTASINPTFDGHPLSAMTVVGRAGPGGPVDRVTLVDGRWATRPGEIVLAVDGELRGPPPGERELQLPDLPGNPTLTVVGTARSISATAGGWVAPAQIPALTSGGSGGYQMLYRFDEAGTAAQVAAGRAAVTAGLPKATLTGATSWLAVKQQNVENSALFVPFLLAFGVLGLVMAVLIVGNVVAGAVGAATHRIGILKALGFTPAQVMRAYVGQALIPAAVGAALGVVAGNLLVVPLLAETNDLYGTSDSGVAPWVDAAVVAGALGVVALTAWAAALRAGRLRTVDALAVGRTPRPGRGQWASRLTGRLPLPRPVTLGLAHPFARPVRALTMVAAIAFGATAVTFAAGLGASLHGIQDASEPGDVLVVPGRPVEGAPPGAQRMERGPEGAATRPTVDVAAVAAAIDKQPGTSFYTSSTHTDVTVAGLSGSREVIAFTGNGTARGWNMISGRWLSGPGEIVVSTPFLTGTGTRVGDTIVLTDKGKTIPVKIAGEVFHTEDDGTQILTSIATLAAAEPDLRADQFQVSVRDGTDPEAYAEKLNTALGSLDAQAFSPRNGPDEILLIIDTLTGFLTLMLVTVAGLGVLNTVVLETRQRVHDLGVHKALGMTPRQTIAMVLASVVVIGLVGGAVGVPIGLALHERVVRAMGHTAGFNLPDVLLDVYGPAQLALFGLGGLLIAILGALLPATWAAGTRTATALRTE